MTNARLQIQNAGSRIDLRVIPRSAKNAIGVVRDGRLVLRVTAPPVDGAANQAVIALLAEVLDVGKSAIRIVGGETARNKTVEIVGLAIEEARRRLKLCNL